MTVMTLLNNTRRSSRKQFELEILQNNQKKLSAERVVDDLCLLGFALRS